MHPAGKVATTGLNRHFLYRLVADTAPLAFSMIEPGDAASDPSMLCTVIARGGNGWRVGAGFGAIDSAANSCQRVK